MSKAASPALTRLGPLATHRAVSVAQVAAATRFSFRGGDAAVATLGKAFGCVPSLETCRASSEGERTALWLGPDEWMLIAPDGQAAALFSELEAALADTPHSLVDISHRNIGFEVVGEAAPAVLNAGCPLDFDLDAFPVGMCTRTVLGKAEVVIWRQGEQRFRIEAWRSFAFYTLAFLTQAIENEAL